MATKTAERVTLAEVKQGETKRVGDYTIHNRSPFTIEVSEGSRGGYQYRVNGLPITRVMRFCGGELSARFDTMRAVLSFMGLGEAVADDTVTCQLSSGRRSKAFTESGIKRNPHHGHIDPIPTAMQSILRAIFTATAEVAEAGKTKRRTGEKIGTGKSAVEFNWQSPHATKMVVSEAGSVKVKAKKTK